MKTVCVVLYCAGMIRRIGLGYETTTRSVNVSDQKHKLTFALDQPESSQFVHSLALRFGLG